MKVDYWDVDALADAPLMEWGWSRKDCIQAIRDAGLPLPGKSSCFFCPSMKRWEIRTLYHRYPDLLRRALAIEDAAMPNLTSVRGLGRNWAWRDFICADENQLAIPGAFSDEGRLLKARGYAVTEDPAVRHSGAHADAQV